jgi:hypothetical protein
MNSKGQKILTDLAEVIESYHLTLIKTIGNIALILTESKEIKAPTSRILGGKNLRGITQKAKKVIVPAQAKTNMLPKVSMEEIRTTVIIEMRIKTAVIGLKKWQI